MQGGWSIFLFSRISGEKRLLSILTKDSLLLLQFKIRAALFSTAARTKKENAESKDSAFFVVHLQGLEPWAH